MPGKRRAVDSDESQCKRTSLGVGSSKFDTLVREILARSKAQDWASAQREWSLEHVYRVEWENAGTCLCTHSPILEICVVENEHTGEQAEVGNCCVKKFMDLPSEAIFAAVRRVKQDGAKSLNEVTIQFAHEHDWINDWEYQFYTDTFRKRDTTDRQQDHRERINEKVIGRMSRRRQCEADANHLASDVWTLNKVDLERARAEGKINEWEEQFYVGNLGKDFVTKLQMPVKRRIDAKVASDVAAGDHCIRWPFSMADIHAAHAAARISSWELQFYADVHGNVQLSEKQQQAKERIDARLDGSASGVCAVPSAAQDLRGAGLSWPHDIAAVEQAFQQKAINDWEKTFYTQSSGKAHLSDKQLAIKLKIESKIATHLAQRASFAVSPPRHQRTQCRAGNLAMLTPEAQRSRLSGELLLGQHHLIAEPVAAPPPVAMGSTLSTLSAEDRLHIERKRSAALERQRARAVTSPLAVVAAVPAPLSDEQRAAIEEKRFAALERHKQREASICSPAPSRMCASPLSAEQRAAIEQKRQAALARHRQRDVNVVAVTSGTIDEDGVLWVD